MSHVKGYTKVINGQVVFVPQHDDSRQKHDGKRNRHGQKDFGRAPDFGRKYDSSKASPGMQKMRDTITGLLRTKAGLDEIEQKIKAGGFKSSLPEVLSLYGLEQGAHHVDLDAFDHTMSVLRHLPDDADDNTRWAALLHDIGKADTQKHVPGRGTVFDGHEKAGHDKAFGVLERLGFDEDDAKEILYMIKDHGNIRSTLLRAGDEDGKKYVSHPHFGNLLKLHRADVISSGRDPGPVTEAADKFLGGSVQKSLGTLHIIPIDLVKAHVKAHFKRDPQTGKLIFIHDYDDSRHRKDLHVRFERGDRIENINQKSKSHHGKTGEFHSYDAKHDYFWVKFDGDKKPTALKADHVKHLKEELRPENIHQHLADQEKDPFGEKAKAAQEKPQEPAQKPQEEGQEKKTGEHPNEPSKALETATIDSEDDFKAVLAHHAAQEKVHPKPEMMLSSHSDTLIAMHRGENGIEAKEYKVKDRKQADAWIKKHLHGIEPKEAPAAGEGKKKAVYTASGAKIDVQYAVRESADLIASHDAEGNENTQYPQEMQPRDRGKLASKYQIAKIANSLKPELLGDSAKVSDGAPIIGDDGVVESGNGRTIAIGEVYKRGEGDAYRKWLEENASDFGLDPEEIKGMKHPVLVRVRKTDVNRAEFAKQANQSDLVSMSPAEQAKTDAERITEADLDLFNADSGDVLSSANHGFIKNFLSVMGSNEASQYLTKDGGYTKQLADRVQAAIFAKAYGDERLIALMAEGNDEDTKNIVSALTHAAPKFAKIKALGEIPASINVIPHVIEGTEILRKAKSKGASLEQHLAQGNMFHKPHENSVFVAQILSKNAKSTKRMGELLGTMATFLKSQVQAAGNMSMFQKVVTPKMIIDQANKKMEKDNAK